MAAAVGALLWFRHAAIIGQDPILARSVNMGAGDLNVRFALWRMAQEAFLSRPLMGWGQEGFSYVFNGYYDPSLAGQEPWFDRAHNLYLDTLIAGGLPALLLFLATFLSAAYGLWRAPFSRAGRIVLLGGLLAYAVQALVVFDNLLTYVPFAAMLALAHSTASRPIAALTSLRQLDGRWIDRVAAPLVVVVSLALVLWCVNVPTLRASRDLIRALAPAGGGPLRLGYLKRAVDDHGFASQEIREKLARVAIVVARSPDGPEDDKRQFVAYAVDQVRRELANAPHEARLRLQLARLYRSTGDVDDARREIALALADAPRHPQLLEERDLDGARGGGEPPP